MHIEPQGIVLYPSELKALLKFAAKDDENPLAVVHFRTDNTWLIAYATTGHRALQAKGVAEKDAVRGEWTVARSFLAAGLRLLQEGQYLVLEVTGASVQGARVRDTKTLEDVSELTWPTDAASTQTTFPIEGCERVIELPTTERPIRCVSVNAEYLQDLTVVAKAAGSDCLDLFPGKTREHPLVFRIDELDTEWRGAIAPLRRDKKSETEDVEPPPELFDRDVTVQIVTNDGELLNVPLNDVARVLAEQKKGGTKKNPGDRQQGLQYPDPEPPPDNGTDGDSPEDDGGEDA